MDPSAIAAESTPRTGSGEAACAVPTLANIFALQLEQSRAEPPAAWQLRAERLRRLRDLLREHRGAVADAISADFGQRSRHETELLEINPVLDGIGHVLRQGRAWMRPRRRNPGYKFWPGTGWLVPQPLGVAGIVVPWNYPLMLSLGPVTSALVAGNRALVKMSELTPRFGELLARLVAQRFAADELRVFNGDAAFSRQFCQLPFDHLLFTGSTAVGHQVMRAASEHLTPVTLELGGKSPAIIGPGADFDEAVRRIVIGKTFNAGQTCIAPDYALVRHDRLTQFVDAARRAVAQFYPSLAATADYTSIISERHFRRLEGVVEDALARGAHAWPLSAAQNDVRRRLFAPVVLSGLAPDSIALQEEIFGPVLPVVTYARIEEAIAWVNARSRPLALYLFEQDRAAIDKVLAETVSGGVTVNDTFLHAGVDSLPFGGVGASGMGAYHGEEGFRTFSHLKPVFRRARFGLLPWLYPPYGRRAERLLRMPRQ